MTSYHGGKQRIGKKLAQIIVEESIDISQDEGWKIKGYCEPFAGMLGVYQHIPELYEENNLKLKYQAGDINKSVIMMWKESQKGWKPPTKCTKTQFMSLKNNGMSSPEKGFIGHICAFRSVYFQVYANHITESRLSNTSNKVSQIGTDLKKVTFKDGNYMQFSSLKNHVIYCDPPYEDTRQEYYNDNNKKHIFNSSEFWEWCRRMSKHNIVFVSSYSAPKDFEQIWSSGLEKLYLNMRDL